MIVRFHGSGTAIGDALELEGINMARTELNAEKVPITVGSNKGNLGNCEARSSFRILNRLLTHSLQAAGGLISVIKMCKSIQNGVIPAMPSFERLNPMINADLPITIAAHEVPLTDKAIVSVSSTGLGGVNAHCVLRAPPSYAQRVPDTIRRSSRHPSSTFASEIQEYARKITQCASDILGIEVQEDTSLHAAGLDSQGQVLLMHRLAKVIPSTVLP
jgi:acyl transferase domain-containing protein